MTNYPLEARELLLLDLIRTGVGDWIHAADLRAVLEVYAALQDPAEAREIGLWLISTALNRGLLSAAKVIDQQMEPWTVPEAIAGAEESWPPDDYPEIGKFPLWLKVTPAGTALLRARGLADGGSTASMKLVSDST